MPPLFLLYSAKIRQGYYCSPKRANIKQGKERAMSSVIKKIESHSPLLHKAHEGDRLVSINGHEIIDVLDYKFFSLEPPW